MDKNTLQKATKSIENIREEFSEEMANEMVKILENAKQGDKNAGLIVSAAIKMSDLTAIKENFKSNTFDCDEIHREYRKNVEKLKIMHWGNPVKFDKALSQLNNDYMRAYKHMRGDREEYKKHSGEYLKLCKKVQEMYQSVGLDSEEFILPNDWKQQFSDEELSYAPKTRSEAIRCDEESFMRDLDVMDKLVGEVRNAMHADFEIGKLAVGVILSSAQEQQSQDSLSMQ